MAIGEALAAFLEGDAHAPYPSIHNEAAILRAAGRIAEKYGRVVDAIQLAGLADSIMRRPASTFADLRETAAETYGKLQDLVTSMAKAQHEGLMGRVNEMLANLPDGCFVAVSPADMGDITSGVANIAYTLRALMPGMPVPEGWTAYARCPKNPQHLDWMATPSFTPITEP